ncbi:hypothetical protein [Streptomyces sp. NPDC090022]|uniref:hypothetical protein n=1 Tax=Streptomyces sp. NPDC090022 TaxID=3365920 RepID=UPI003819AED4
MHGHEQDEDARRRSRGAAIHTRRAAEAVADPGAPADRARLLALQSRVGNRAVGRLLVQRQSLEPSLAGAGAAGALALSQVEVVSVIGSAGIAGRAAALVLAVVGGEIVVGAVVAVAVAGAVAGAGYLLYLNWQQLSGAAGAPRMPYHPPPGRIGEANLPPPPVAVPQPVPQGLDGATTGTGPWVGPISLTLTPPIERAVIRQIAVERPRTQGQECVVPDYQGYANIAHLMALEGVGENVNWWIAHAHRTPHGEALRRDRSQMITQVCRQGMYNVMVAFSCQGDLLAMALGAKHYDDEEHAEEKAAPVMRAELRTRRAAGQQALLAGGTLVSMCQQEPCRGQYKGHHCLRLLNRIAREYLPGGQVEGVAVRWPPGYRRLLFDAYNARMAARKGRALTAAELAPRRGDRV